MIKPKTTPPYYTAGGNVKEYEALLTQSSTNPPIIIVLLNTLGYIPTIEYSDVGDYFLIGNEEHCFNRNKTTVVINSVTGTITNAITTGWNFNDDAIEIQTYNETGTIMNGLLDKTTIKIKVYP